MPTLIREIIDQVRNCSVYRELARNAVGIAELQSKKLEEEEKRFSRGRSDTDTIIRFQKDLSQAEIAASHAKFRYISAVVDLRKNEGVLLNKYWDRKI